MGIERHSTEVRLDQITHESCQQKRQVSLPLYTIHFTRVNYSFLSAMNPQPLLSLWYQLGGIDASKLFFCDVNI